MVKHTIRTSNNGRREVELTPTLAIKLHCVECCGWETQPKDCSQETCPLYPFRGYSRLSHGNYKPMTEEQKVAARERFAECRAKK